MDEEKENGINEDWLRGFEDACVLIGSINKKKQGKDLEKEMSCLIAQAQ